MTDAAFWTESYTSGDYLKQWDYEVPSQELVAIVAALGVPPDGVSLDLGCGAGREAIFLARCGFRSIGIDWSEKALEIARGRAREAGVKVDLRCASVLALPLPDASVDFVNDRGCFHHVAEKDRGRYAAELYRVVVPEGAVLLRGSRANDTFVPVTQESVDRHFAPYFARGAVLPIRLVADSGPLEANVVVLRRR